MIEGEVLHAGVFPDAGWPGYCWCAVVLRPDGEEEEWTRVRSYKTRAGAERAMSRWVRSRSQRGMVLVERVAGQKVMG